MEDVKKLAQYILDCAKFASDSTRIDGVRFAPSAKGAKTIEELYKKTRTEYFSDADKVKILLGNFVVMHENYKDYYVKARKILGGAK